MEKDATEIELEKLVFGDESGFREGVRSHKLECTLEENYPSEDGFPVSEGEREPGDDEGLEGVDDADVGNKFRLSNRHC
jgi:U3 small nucleolar RNA-associated protein 18